MKLIRLLAIGLILSSPAHAQSWDSGAVTPNWSLSTWTPPIGTDSAHPADAYEPAIAATDRVIYNANDWLVNSGGRSNPGTMADGANASVGGSPEAKARFQCPPSMSARADPILVRNQQPAGHGHTFAGWGGPGAKPNVKSFSYTAGRASPFSTCDGGPFNATLYWEPSMYRQIGGVIFTVKPKNFIFYYVLTPKEGQEATRLRRNLRFIGGANPADYNDTAKRAELTAAGLTYSSGTPTTPAGFGGFTCFAPDGLTKRNVLSAHARTDSTGTVPNAFVAKYLKGPNGEDPWGGTCTAGVLIQYINAPQCWDGNNLGSPNGRDHFRYAARNPNTGQTTCPLNYVKVPHFETATHFDHNGWTADLQYWYLASDRMNPPSTPGDSSSLDPCRQTGPYYCPGATAHFDWWGAQDDIFMKEWQRNCIGMVIDGIDGVHADCGTGGFKDAPYGQLKTSGTSPDTQWSPAQIGTIPAGQNASPSATGQRYFPVDPADQVQSGTLFDLHTGHGG